MRKLQGMALAAALISGCLLMAGCGNTESKVPEGQDSTTAMMRGGNNPAANPSGLPAVPAKPAGAPSGEKKGAPKAGETKGAPAGEKKAP